MAEKSTWDQANRRQKLGLVWRNRKKISVAEKIDEISSAENPPNCVGGIREFFLVFYISQIIKDYFYLLFIL
jgi:hypothetical protein